MIRRVRDENGSALVEFAFVFPVLLLVVMGSLSLLWMLTARSALSGAARDGARFASIRHDFVCDTSPCDTDWPSQDEVKAYVKDNLARYKSPREVVFMDELPRNTTGKVLKRELQEA